MKLRREVKTLWIPLLVMSLLTAIMSCALDETTRPVIEKPGAVGAPQDGGGGEEGGGGGGMTVNLGDSFNGELGDTLIVPVHVNGVIDTTKGFQATIRASSGLSIVSSSIGAYLTNADPNAFGWAGFNSDGSYTMVATMGPGHCSTSGFGTIFNVKVTSTTEGEHHVTLVASPEGAVTPSPYANKCQTNGPLSVTYGNTNTNCTYVNP